MQCTTTTTMTICLSKTILGILTIVSISQSITYADLQSVLWFYFLEKNIINNMHKFQASKWFIMCSLNAYYDNKRKTLKYILYSFYFLVFF